MTQSAKKKAVIWTEGLDAHFSSVTFQLIRFELWTTKEKNEMVRIKDFFFSLTNVRLQEKVQSSMLYATLSL